MTTSAAASTERQRLVEVASGFVDALGDRAFHRLRLSPSFRCTENAQDLPLGSGLWRTILQVRPGGHYFADVDRGQVAYWGAVEEMAGPALLGARLKVRGRLLSEVELVVVRHSAYFEPDSIVLPAPGFHDELHPGDRVARAQLVEAADRYFDAIELSDGDLVPVRDECRRLVNGVLDSREEAEALPAGERHRALSVADQITEGHYSYIEELRDRRYPIVDADRGIVHAVVLFDHPGDLMRASGEVPFGAPNSMLYFEVFKVRGGLIEEIWALGASLAYGARSGWG